MVRPRAMVNMASVATKGGTLNRVMVNPLNQPRKVPASVPPIRAPTSENPTKRFMSGISAPNFNIPAVTAPENANMEPTDKSMPPVNITRVIPTDITTFTEICRITFHAFSPVRKRSDKRLRTMHMITSAMMD